MQKDRSSLRRIDYLFFTAVWIMAWAHGAEGQDKPGSVNLESESWRVVVEPEFGGRCSSLYSKNHEYDFVLHWAKSKDDKGVESASGGIFRGNMCGSYESEQMDEPYAVNRQGPNRLSMHYRNEHPMFSGLEEKRVVSLIAGGRTVQLDLTVSNRSKDDRTLYYRFNDILSTGNQNGLDTLCLTPGKDGTVSAVTSFRPPREGINSHRITFMYKPAEPWFALVDLAGDAGLLVEIDLSPVQQIMYWLGRPHLRTAEIFFPITPLKPGKSWKARIRYTAFSPSKPDLKNPRFNKLLSTDAVQGHLRKQKARQYETGMPLNAKMQLELPGQTARITPLHPADPRHGTAEFVRYAGTLEEITLYGAPGEVVPLAFAVTTSHAVKDGWIEYADLASGGNIIVARQFDTRHVSQDGWGYLVRDWKLARAGLPDGVGLINNNIRDSKTTTAFSLDAKETAFLWSYLRIPQDARPGRYVGSCSVKARSGTLGRFKVNLVVYPFDLLRPKNKIRGSFFRYKLKTGARNEYATNITKDVYSACLKDMAEMGYNGITIYDNSKENILWILDECVELGWKNCLFVMIHADAVQPQELRRRYGRHGFKFLGWLVDEPTQYKRIPQFLTRVQQVSSRWGNKCMFTPNTPLGVAMAEATPQTVPNFAHMGTSAYLVDLTRRYKANGREVYWYGMPFGEPAAHKRLFNGICLWKEPVDGIMDWGEDSMRGLAGDSMSGFAGTTMIPTLARENIRQAYHDLYYLHTLEQAIAEAGEDDPQRKEAQKLLDRIRNQFDFVFSAEGDRFTQGYMDVIRQEVARQICDLEYKDATGRR